MDNEKRIAEGAEVGGDPLEASVEESDEATRREYKEGVPVVLYEGLEV